MFRKGSGVVREALTVGGVDQQCNPYLPLKTGNLLYLP